MQSNAKCLCSVSLKVAGSSANKDFKRVSTLFHPEKGLSSDFWSFMVNKVLSLLTSCNYGCFATSQEEEFVLMSKCVQLGASFIQRKQQEDVFIVSCFSQREHTHMDAH